MSFYRRSAEDLRNPHRVLFQLIRDYENGRLTQSRIFYRARVEKVGTRIGEIEADPPSPVGAVQARVYTYGMDANIPSEALNIFYPTNKGDIPQIGEHIYVVFEDETFSSGLWICRIPNYTDINYANPDLFPKTAEPSSADAFEGTSPRSPSQGDVELNYQSPPLNSLSQRQTADSFEKQSSYWDGKKVYIVGDSNLAPPSPMISALKTALQNRGAVSVVVDGRSSWQTIHWIQGQFNGRNSNKFSGPKISDIIQRERPDVMIVLLGGNDASGGRNDQSIQESVSQIWSQAQQADDALWIAPPVSFKRGQQRRRDEVSEIIKRVVKEESFVDSRIITNINAGRSDGLHFRNDQKGKEITKSWAELVVQKRI